MHRQSFGHLSTGYRNGCAFRIQNDPGELAAISLAIELHADALLIDEKSGRRAAAERGYVTIGVLGILTRADELGLIRL